MTTDLASILGWGDISHLIGRGANKIAASTDVVNMGGWTDDGVNVRLTTPADTVTIGTSTAPPVDTKLLVTIDDATNNAPDSVLVLRHTTSGTAQAGIGTAVLFQSEDAAGTAVDGGKIASVLTSVTAGAVTGALDLYTRTLGGALTARWRVTGAGDFTPILDNAYVVGAAATRVSNVITRGVTVYTSASDANASTFLSPGQIQFGPGGAGALECAIGRSDVNTLQLTGTNGVNPSANFTPFGTSALRWNATCAGFAVNFSAFNAGGGTFNCGSATNYVELDTTGGNIACVLTNPATVPPGFEITVKKIVAANTVTVTSAAGTIDGAASTTLTSRWAALTFTATGTNWEVKSDYSVATGAQSTTTLIADPGNLGAIPNDTSGYCPMACGAGSSRTLALPTAAGLDLTLSLASGSGGGVEIVVAGGFNDAGNTDTILYVVNIATCFIRLFSYSRNGGLKWRFVDGNNYNPS